MSDIRFVVICEDYFGKESVLGTFDNLSEATSQPFDTNCKEHNILIKPKKKETQNLET